MTQIFRVTLPTAAQHKLHGGVISFVFRVQLASDSFSEMNLSQSRLPHAEWLQSEAIAPLIDVVGAAVAHTEAICAWFMAVSDEAVSSSMAAGYRSSVMEVQGEKKDAILRDI